MKWKKTKIGDVCSMLSGNAWSASKFKEKGLVPIIRIQNLGGNIDEKFVYWDDPYDKKYIIEKGDLLISLSGSIKVNYWNRENALLNQRIVRIKVHHNLHERFFYWNLTKSLGQIEKMGKHALVNNVSINDLKNLEITLPPISIQKQIADTIDKADELRRTDQDLIQLYNELERSIFYEIFGDPVRNEKGWEVRKMHDITEFVQIGPFGSLLHAEDYITGGTPLVNPSHIKNGKIVPDENLTVNDSKINALNSYRMRIGDVVMGRRGEMGRCAVVTEREDGWLCGTGSLFVRPNDMIKPQILANFLSSSSMKMILETSSMGTTMSNLNQNIVKNLEVIVPALSAQMKYLSLYNSLALQSSLLQRNLTNSSKLFSTLLGQSFE